MIWEGESPWNGGSPESRMYMITPALHRITGPTNRIRYKSVRQAACWTLAYPAEAFLNVIGVFVTVEVVVDPAKILAPGSRRAMPTTDCTPELLTGLDGGKADEVMEEASFTGSIS